MHPGVVELIENMNTSIEQLVIFSEELPVTKRTTTSQNQILKVSQPSLAF
jgi:hypothetical protein